MSNPSGAKELAAGGRDDVSVPCPAARPSNSASTPPPTALRAHSLGHRGCVSSLSPWTWPNDRLSRPARVSDRFRSPAARRSPAWHKGDTGDRLLEATILIIVTTSVISCPLGSRSFRQHASIRELTWAHATSASRCEVRGERAEITWSRLPLLDALTPPDAHPSPSHCPSYNPCPRGLT